MALKDALRAAIEVGDFASADKPAQRLQDHRPVARRRARRLGADRPARRTRPAAPRTRSPPIASPRRPATGRRRRRAGSARSRFAIRWARPRRPTIIGELENLTTAWRGDETEVEALQLLARLYTEEDRYRDAFHVMRVALTAFPTSPLTRNIQSEAAKTFDTLFLAGKGDALPAIDALGLFYDFRDLTPIGRRGDEMIRRLAERLVSVDLLDQARRAAAIPGRQPPAGRRPRAGGDAARGDLSDEPQAGRRRRPCCAPPAPPTSPTRSACRG